MYYSTYTNIISAIMHSNKKIECLNPVEGYDLG